MAITKIGTTGISNNLDVPGYIYLSGDEKELRFYNGSNYQVIKASSSLSNNYTFVLPVDDGTSGQYLQTNGSGVMTWASVSADTNTTYSTSWVDSSNDAILRLTPSTGSADDLTIVAGSGITLTPSGDNLTIASSGGAALTGSTDNTVVTVTGANTIQGEANLGFTGTNLGIGVLDPDNFLEIKGGNNAYININHTGGAGGYQSGILFKTSDTQNYKIDVTGNGDMTWRAGASEVVKMVLDDTGYVDFTKSGGGTTTNGHFRLHHAGTSTGLTTLPQTSHVSSAEAVATDTYFSIQPGWYTANGGSAIMKSFSQGNTGFYLTSWIGTFWTTQASNQGATCQIMMRPHDGSNGNLTINTSANICAMGYYDGSTSARRFFFRADGTGYADASWTTFSDNRLKFNQEVVPYGLDTIMQLQPKVYDKYSGAIEDGVVTLEDASVRREIGFVAQEIKALVPEIVPNNADENNGWYSLEDGKLMAVVVKAIQELNAKIDALGS